MERCGECGFDGGGWTDRAALDAIAGLPARWLQALDGLPDEDLQRRPIVDRWSVAEYADHVRETLFGMRFLLDTVIDAPGTDLGAPPAPAFDPEARPIDVDRALGGLRSEAVQLHDQLTALDETAWASTVVVGADEVDVPWIARHAVHDATHHLGDVERLRALL